MGITRKEIIDVLRRLRRAKAPGLDGIENETWRLMPMGIGEKFHRFLDTIWKWGGLPEDRRKGMMIPIHKKKRKGGGKQLQGGDINRQVF